MNEHLVVRNSQLAFVRSLILMLLVLELLFFHIYPIDLESSAYIITLFSLIYLILSIIYFKKQIKLWERSDKFRFVSWYYISFSIISIVVLLAMSVISYFLFTDVLITIVTFTLFITEIMRLWAVYYHSLHFIAVNPEYILLVKNNPPSRWGQKIYPQDITDILYRNDILIFKLSNEKTIFFNFIEINNADKLKNILAEWILKNNLNEYQEIANSLKKSCMQ